MEKREEVITVLVDYECPECKIGRLRPTGLALSSNPPQYPHKCNNPDCEYCDIFVNIKYPYIEYKGR